MENTNRNLNEDPAKNKQYNEGQQQDSVVRPDSETLHTTDPQEHMHGPVSSLMNGVGDAIKNQDQDGEEKPSHEIIDDEQIAEDDESN